MYTFLNLYLGAEEQGFKHNLKYLTIKIFVFRLYNDSNNVNSGFGSVNFRFVIIHNILILPEFIKVGFIFINSIT